MANLLNKDPLIYVEERSRFIKELRQFHQNKGTPFKNIPTIDGRDIDLYLLYWLVTAKGGWEKVNRRSAWDQLLETFEIPDSTVNGAILLKQTYLRYLDTYEKIHYLGEDDDGDDDDWYKDAEDSRSRRQKSQRVQNSIPLSYNNNQHNVSDEARVTSGLSTNVHKKTDYDRLSLSLTSPLPNEQDFGINVCTLLSNEGRHTLKLEKCERLLDLLLAHAGVFNHPNLNEYLNGIYRESRGYDLTQFWVDVCRDKIVRDLMLNPPTLEPRPTTSKKHKSSCRSPENKNRKLFDKDDKRYPTYLSSSTSKYSGVKRLELLIKHAESDLAEKCFGDNDEDGDLFARGTKNGTQESAGQRILQIATIIRNLSFEEDNAIILSKNLTCLRFCLLCASSRWSNINQMGFDILSNIATEVALQETANTDSCVTDVLLSTLSTCLSSDDRFQVISSLDVLTKICSLEINEDFIGKMLTVKQTQNVYEQLVAYLSLHDIHLLISTLECLYSLSCIGEATCNCIIRTQGAVDALVSLITVEAQSYGPKACILMRVVETVPGSAAMAAAQGGTTVSIEQQIPHDTLSSTSSGATNMPSLQLPLSSKPLAQPVTTTIQLQHAQRPLASAASPSVQTTNLIGGQQTILRGQLVQRSIQVAPQQTQVINAQQIMTVGRQQPVQTVNSQPMPHQTISQSTQQSAIVTQHVIQQQKTNIQHQPIVISAQPQQQIVVMSQQPQQQVVSMQHQPQKQLVPQQGQPVHLQQVHQQTSIGVQHAMAPQLQSQQVQLRVSNDESNRQFCLSWLKATYESSSGSSIDQQVMYKQYLASLHKLGKRDVISQQHYAVCIRNLFGGSVGPIRKQLPSGQFQNVYEGVKVRAQPLPLRVPTSPQQQAIQQQTQVIQQQPFVNQGGIRDAQQVPIQATTPTATTEENGSSVLDGILPKDFGSLTKDERSNVTFQTNNNGTSVHNSGNKGMLPNLLDGKQSTTNEKHINKPMVNGMTNKPTTYISNNMVVDSAANVKKMNGGLENTTLAVTPTGNTFGQNQQTLKRPSSDDADGQAPAKKVMLDPQQLSNGISNGQADVSEMDENSSPILKTDVNLAQAAVNSQGVGVMQQQQKIVQQVSQQTDQQQLAGNNVLPQQQTQRILTTADGKQILVKSPAQGNVLTVQPQQLAAQGGQSTPGAKTIIILQPQNKVLNAQGQPQPTMLMSQPNTVSSAPGTLQPQVIMQGGQQVGTVTPITYMNAQSLPPASVMAVAGGYAPQNGNPVNHISQTNATFMNGGQNGSSAINNPQNMQHVRHSSGSSGSVTSGTTVIRQSPTPPIQGIQQQVQSRVQSPLPASVAASIANVSLPSSATSNLSTPGCTNSNNSQLHPTSNASNSVSQQMAQPSLPQTPHPPATNATIQPQYVPVPQGVLPPPNPQRPFICEWAGCMKDFRTPKEVEKHAILEHCSDVAEQGDMPCLWSRCDGMKRKRFSLMTHIQDRHCHPQMMKLIAVRRVQMAQTGKTDVPLPPAPPPHPGYAPNAALHAIKRHAQEFATPKAQAMSDEKEGPVTKSIRLTSALILKNLVMCSSLGKKRLKSYESHLATVALSNVESSRTVSQILYEMAEIDPA